MAELNVLYNITLSIVKGTVKIIDPMQEVEWPKNIPWNCKFSTFRCWSYIKRGKKFASSYLMLLPLFLGVGQKQLCSTFSSNYCKKVAIDDYFHGAKFLFKFFLGNPHFDPSKKCQKPKKKNLSHHLIPNNIQFLF